MQNAPDMPPKANCSTFGSGGFFAGVVMADRGDGDGVSAESVKEMVVHAADSRRITCLRAWPCWLRGPRVTQVNREFLR